VLKDHKELAKVRSRSPPRSIPRRLSLTLSLALSCSQGERAKKAKRAAGNGMSPEEALALQEQLFAASRAKLEAGAAPGEAPAETS